ncbi:hypothetical protein B0I37DRAFT_400041 [Chaetomium sp. MPI-CAGE-AT-0009]|nr:hypothetical protein B0I37DRAFT_400041 [Chaetomium sp. MPI-CAGE-AT-0009]
MKLRWLTTPSRVLVLPIGILSIACAVNAQQFNDTVLGNRAYPGLSDECAEALNTTVKDCPGFLAAASVDMPRLDSSSLDVLCTSACRSSLTSVRKVIAEGCRADKDAIEIRSVVYPGMIYLFTWESGKFCDELYLNALANGTAADSCSDCSLNLARVQLNSPFGYHQQFAQGFQSITSKCGATVYAFTSPAKYAISTKSVSAPTDPPTCGSPYAVGANDTCDSIATAKNVSTYSVRQAAGAGPECNLQDGAKLCLPEPCTVYRVQYDDTCKSILDSHPQQQFLVPQTPKNDSNTRCAHWYEIQTGDYCEAISIRQNIPLRDFYFLNPSINSSDCLNLWLETAYCVKAVGDINTYSGYPYSTTPIYTLTSSNYITTTVRSVDTVKPIATPIVELPLAPGSLTEDQGCLEFTNHRVVVPQRDQSQQQDVPAFTKTINNCNFVSALFGVFLEDFLAWNPSLKEVDPCRLQRDTDEETPPGDRPCFEVPEPYPGTVPSCSCFTTVIGYDAGLYGCEDIAHDQNITMSDLVSWNPWVGSESSCDTECKEKSDAY